MYSIWQDAGNRTRVAATAARFATNERDLEIFAIFDIGQIFLGVHFKNSASLKTKFGSFWTTQNIFCALRQVKKKR